MDETDTIVICRCRGLRDELRFYIPTSLHPTLECVGADQPYIYLCIMSGHCTCGPLERRLPPAQN